MYDKSRLTAQLSEVAFRAIVYYNVMHEDGGLYLEALGGD